MLVYNRHSEFGGNSKTTPVSLVGATILLLLKKHVSLRIFLKHTVLYKYSKCILATLYICAKLAFACTRTQIYISIMYLPICDAIIIISIILK